MTSRPNLTRRTVLREGAVAFPAWWPSRPRSAMLAGMATAATRQGYANVRVDDVIELARGSRRTFYAYFDGRESCLLEAHEMVLADCLRAVDEGPQELEAALARLMRYLACVARTRPSAAGRDPRRRADGRRAVRGGDGRAGQPPGHLRDPRVRSPARSATTRWSKRASARCTGWCSSACWPVSTQALPRLTPALVELVTLHASR